MKDLMGSRWLTEPTEEESCFASLSELRAHWRGLAVGGCSSSLGCDETEERRLPQGE